MAYYKERGSEQIIANDMVYDSVEDYLADCDIDNQEIDTVEKCNEIALQIPNADEIIGIIIDNVADRADEVIPEDWSYGEIYNYFIDIDDFKNKLNDLINEFNDKQQYSIWQGNGKYISKEQLKEMINGTL